MVVQGGAGNAVVMRVVEIGALNHAAEHLLSKRESATVDALADAFLRVRFPRDH